MSAVGDDTYPCPVCGKPFDRSDKLFDFAIAAHEKDHAPQRNNPANMILWHDDSLMWCCKLCGDPLHIGEFTARQKAISHCREKHGSMTASPFSAPVTARGGRGSGSSRGFGEAVGDIVEDCAEGIGKVFKAIGEAVGDALSGD